MSALEVIIRATLKMVLIWGTGLMVAIPLVKLIIDVAYAIWKE